MIVEISEGRGGNFRFTDWANFYVHAFALLKFRFFSCGVLCARFAVFFRFSVWFSVFVNNDGSFFIFLPNAFYSFSGFAKEALHLTVTLKL